MDDASNFFITTDDRIELAVFGRGREVATVLFEALLLPFRVLVRDALGSAHTLERVPHRVGRDTVLRQKFLYVGAAFGDPDQLVLGDEAFILIPFVSTLCIRPNKRSRVESERSTRLPTLNLGDDPDTRPP